MTWLTSFFGWLGDFFGDPANWSGTGGIPARLLEHLEFSALALLLAAVIAVPLGLLIGHTGRGEVLVVVTANLARALPTLGLLVMFVLLLLGTASIWPVIIPLVLLSVPPILVNTFEGIKGVDPELRDAAYGMGLRGGQVLGRVLVPVALPLILLGCRLSAIQVVATTTVAAYTGLGGTRPLCHRRFRDQGLRERRRWFRTDCAVRARCAGAVRSRPESGGLSGGEPAPEGSLGFAV
ncbi:hypothetical protein GCM10020001_029280 [Nonomuraea salmonea]